MRCDRARIAASAQLDGEPLGVPASSLDAHLAGCPACTHWVQEAARVSRLTTLDLAVGPDLADRVVAEVAVPARRVRRRRLVLRVALVLAGLVQLGVGAAALAGDSIGMAMAAHAVHEMAAWNIAIGAAFLAVSSRPRRAAGLIPLLAVFLVVLGVLSVHDYADGAVTAARLATHIAALVGLFLVIGLDRSERAQPPSRSAVAHDTHDEDGRPDLRTVA